MVDPVVGVAKIKILADTRGSLAGDRPPTLRVVIAFDNRREDLLPVANLHTDG